MSALDKVLDKLKHTVRSLSQDNADNLLSTAKKTVTVFVPSYPGPKVLTMESLLTMTESLHMFRPDHQVRLELTAGAYLPLMRNLALRRMVEEDKSVGILMVDHDAYWPTVLPKKVKGNGKVLEGFNALDRLISLDKDIVGGLFTTRAMPIQLMCGGFNPADGGLVWLDDVAKGHPLNSEPFQVDWIGAHFLYISKKAALKIAEHVGSYKTLFDCNSRLMIDGRYNSQLDLSLEEYKSGTIDRDAVKKRIETLVDHAGFFQEDVSFCRRAKAAGCEIWVDPKFEVQHIGDYSYGRMDWLALQAMKEQAAIEAGEVDAPQEESLPQVPRLGAVK